MNQRLKHTLLILLALAPVIYLLAIWNTLPDTVPMHYNSQFVPDKYAKKTELLVMLGIFCAVSVGVYLLIKNVHKIDPKRAGKEKSPTFDKLSVGIVLFMSVIGIIIVLATGGDKFYLKAMLPLLGLLFAFLGNVMYNIKPNYFAGIRVPWTLNSEYNWKKTHRLAGKVWFVGGILLAITTLLVPANYMTAIILAFTAIMVIVPIAYSYSIYRKEQSLS